MDSPLDPLSEEHSPYQHYQELLPDSVDAERPPWNRTDETTLRPLDDPPGSPNNDSPHPFRPRRRHPLCKLLIRLFGGPNAAFLWGSLFGLVAAGIDWKHAYSRWWNDDDDDNDDDDNESRDHVGNPLQVWNVSKMFYVISALFYLLEAFLAIASPAPTLAVSTDPTVDGADNEDSESQESRDDDEFYETLFWGPWTFGLAALGDLLSCVLDNEARSWPSIGFELVGMHLYVLNALITLWEHRTSKEAESFADEEEEQPEINHRQHQRRIYIQKVLVWGDVLFLLGALVDVRISYGDIPTAKMASDSDHDLKMATWAVVSAVLWWIDALVYRWWQAKQRKFMAMLQSSSLI